VKGKEQPNMLADGADGADVSSSWLFVGLPPPLPLTPGGGGAALPCLNSRQTLSVAARSVVVVCS
jgi:hypothetical protein